MKTVFTIGHSTRTLEEFISLLLESRIRTVADIRSAPRLENSLGSIARSSSDRLRSPCRFGRAPSQEQDQGFRFECVLE